MPFIEEKKAAAASGATTSVATAVAATTPSSATSSSTAAAPAYEPTRLDAEPVLGEALLTELSHHVSHHILLSSSSPCIMCGMIY
jgi:tRNA(Arg) A34 adenosine deaminase TadA